MNQTKLESLLEVGFNVFVGWIVGLIAQITFFPLIGIEASLSQNLISSVFFTFISIIRSYAIRRWFNAGIHKLVAQFVKRLLRPSL